MRPRQRLDWAKDLPFEVPLVGADVEDLTEVDYLFWVGCAGAYEDRAKKTTRAVAELLHTAGVSFAVLGDGETCTGDPARRAGNEFLFQQLALQNVEMLREAAATKIVVTCAHCFNTLKNEYPQLGGTYEVVHHTQLLNRLVREKRLRSPRSPARRRVADTASRAGDRRRRDRHLPRPLLPRPAQRRLRPPARAARRAARASTLAEMPRARQTSFCCGAGGARMWMEEKLGTRINLNRTEEALATGAEQDRHRLPVLPGDARRRPHRRSRPRARRARTSRSSTSPRCCSRRSASRRRAPPHPRTPSLPAAPGGVERG